MRCSSSVTRIRNLEFIRLGWCVICAVGREERGRGARGEERGERGEGRGVEGGKGRVVGEGEWRGEGRVGGGRGTGDGRGERREQKVINLSLIA